MLTRPHALLAAPVMLAGYKATALGFDLTSPALESLEAKVIRPLAERMHRGGTARVWVPSCGDGAAAYGVAMMFAAAGERLGSAAMPRIFATEREPKVVRAASAGRMSRETARTFLKAGHRRRLGWTGDGWQVKADIRGRILFSVHDTLHETGFSNIDLIVAQAAARQAPGGCTGCLMGLMINALNPGGFLFLGPDRFMGVAIDGLEHVDPIAGLYRRPLTRSQPRRAGRRGSPRGPILLERLAHHFAPSALVVDASGQITATIGTAASLLRHDIDGHSRSVATAAHPDLKPAMINALVEAVRMDAPSCRLADESRDVWVHVESIARSELDAQPLWLVRTSVRHAPERSLAGDAPLLRAHLESTARTLQQTMDEVATQNLALATANDELQSINDELERSNHRLAAVNTELIAVRQDHERQIEELSGLSHDVENLLRSAEIALVVLDAAHRIRRYTPAAAGLFCLTRRDVGHGFGKFLGAHKPLIMEAIERVARDGGNSRLRVDWPNGSGEQRTFQVQIHPYTKDKDKVAGSVVCFVDMSDIKAAQDNLERQNQMLQRANEDLERFAYIASHDLKSPLRSVRTMLEFLRSDLSEVMQADHAEHLDLVAQRVQQMERMIEDLLAYSRLGREDATTETIDVPGLLRAEVDVLDAPETFQIDVQSEVSKLHTDSGLLKHVVRNLVENAIKHHDGVEPKISVHCMEIDGTPVFEVADNGPGIPERYQQRVFEIFQKGGGRANTGGSGMGLALVKKAVERHGGTIALLSKDGERGTTFRFTWPCSAQPEGEGALELVGDAGASPGGN
ncbi:MAG: hypothetical protein EA356_10655 [Geminicoccaceae bacterium]|nr:MAG: hypothetical protein EA356_10655 [Geminicoccaceae bacterium]